MSIIIIPVSWIIFQFIDHDLIWEKHIIWAIIVSIFETALVVFFNFYKTSRNLKNFSLWFNLFFITKIVLILWFCSNMGTASSYLKAQAIVAGIYFLLLLYKFISTYTLKFSLDEIKKMLSYSLPIVPVDLVSIGNRVIDRWFISVILSIEISGIYYIGIQFGGITTLIAMAINSAYIPIFFKEYTEKQDIENIYKIAQSCVFIIIIIGLGISLFAGNIIMLLFDENYYKSIEVIPIIAFNGAILMLYFINTNVLNLEKKLVKYKIVGVLVAFLVNIPLNYLLLKKYGMIGASISTFVSYSISTFVLGVIVSSKTQFKFKNFRIITLISILLLISQYFVSNNIGFTYRCALLMISCFLFLLLNTKRIYA